MNLHRERARRKTAAERGPREGLSQRQAGKQPDLNSPVPTAHREIPEVKIGSKRKTETQN